MKILDDSFMNYPYFISMTHQVGLKAGLFYRVSYNFQNIRPV